MKMTKYVSAPALARIVAQRRAKGQNVVFTNGVYDLLHAGHVLLLEKSRALGDCLIVALNSDASVRRLKGPKRPLCTQEDRIRVVSALACVDYVTVFKEDTPQQILEILKPTTLVKGGDYSLDRIVGRDIVSTVVRVPLLKGRSTTNLVQKILKAYGS